MIEKDKEGNHTLDNMPSIKTKRDELTNTGIREDPNDKVLKDNSEEIELKEESEEDSKEVTPKQQPEDNSKEVAPKEQLEEDSKDVARKEQPKIVGHDPWGHPIDEEGQKQMDEYCRKNCPPPDTMEEIKYIWDKDKGYDVDEDLEVERQNIENQCEYFIKKFGIEFQEQFNMAKEARLEQLKTKRESMIAGNYADTINRKKDVSPSFLKPPLVYWETNFLDPNRSKKNFI